MHARFAASLAFASLTLAAATARAAWTPPPACDTPDPSCGNPSSWVLAELIWGEEVGVCGWDPYQALLTCAATSCGACGSAPGGDTVLDILTQWQNCDPDNCTPDGIPDACGACLESVCASELATYATAGCAP